MVTLFGVVGGAKKTFETVIINNDVLMSVVEPAVVEKVEDEDTDVDESTAQVTGSDSEKMETNSETKPVSYTHLTLPTIYSV